MNWKTLLCVATLFLFLLQPPAPSQNAPLAGTKRKPLPFPKFQFKLFLEPIKLVGTEDALEKLLVERYNEIIAEFKQFSFKSDLVDLMQRTLRATVDFRENPKKRLALLQLLLAQAKHYENYKEQEQNFDRSTTPGNEKYI